MPYPIEGTITDINGSGANAATIYIYNLFNGERISTTTRSNGTYSLDVTNKANKTWNTGEPMLIRAFFSCDPFRIGDRYVTKSGDALSNQDILLKIESPQHPKDMDLRHIDQREHYPPASAKRVYLSDHVDKTTNAIKIIDYEHNEVHGESAYQLGTFADVASDATFDIVFLTPNSRAWMHIVFEAEVEGECEFYVYEGSTATGGTPATPTNRNRNSTKTCGCTIVANPTVTVDGTLLVKTKVGSGKKFGGEARGRTELVLKPNTKYTFRIHNVSAGELWVSPNMVWYVHTNKVLL